MITHRKLSSLGLAALLLAGSAQAGADPFDVDRSIPPPLTATPGPEATALPCPAGPPQGPVTLLVAVNSALCQHPQTREQWANARAQAAQVGVAQAAWLPGLNGTVGASRIRSGTTDDRYNQRSLGLTANWLLYDFGARDAALENARQLLHAANATRDATVQSLFLAAAQSYFQAQATRSAVTAATLAEKAAAESLKAAETRYAVGTATPADRLQARTALAQARLARIQAEGNARNAVGVLANAMGLDAHFPLRLAEDAVAPPPRDFEADLNQLIAEARARRPDLMAAQAQHRAAQAAADNARASGRPSLSLGAAGSRQWAGGDASTSANIGLTLSVPLFTGYATAYRVRAAEAQADSRAAAAERIGQQVALDVWRAYQSLLTAGQSVRTSEELLASATQSEQVAAGRYQAGVGNILDLLNAQTALANARQQRIQALFDWQSARATLAQALGQLDFDTIKGDPASAQPAAR